ncbi:MAG TPA: ribonuclease Y [Planctomycetota bacterium]|nr:ribonuclease Y [Planctomycetota bacterium]
MPIYYAVAAVVGLAAGYAVAYLLVAQSKKTKAALEAAQIVAEATAKSEKALAESRAEAAKVKDDADKQIREERNELRQYENRVSKKEDVIDKRADDLQRREQSVDSRSKNVDRKESEIAVKERDITKIIEEEKVTLHRIAGLTKDDAVKLLLDKLEPELEKEKADLIKKRLDSAKENAEAEARRVISMAIQRFAASHTADSVVTIVDLPSEDLKGRIIGREGRNIRAFERATGVDVIVDDTPGVIVLSAFDGVRREMARRSMEKLIIDGRIHPTRIEEITEQTKREMEEHINNVGKEFLREADIMNVHPKLVTLLGRLKYRTSYGQNVLQHVREVAHLSAVMAAELKLDQRIARRCGVFHDIGKAVDQEFEGSHPVIGGELLKRFEEPKEVVDAAANHHNDPDANFVYTVIAAAADAISASRPGARSESLDRYIKRIQELETLAKSQPGVTGVYAIQAGREIRVLVDCDKISDPQAVILARDIAKQIEQQLTYPGEIRVTVMRESRFVEYAR